MTAPNDIIGEPVTLGPAEYLRVLGLLEGRMPPGTRAYLVHVTHDGRREMTPVPESADVLDLKDGLVGRLQSTMLLDNDWLIGLRDFCNERLERQGGDARSLAVRKAAVLTNECAQIVGSIRDLAIASRECESATLSAIQRLSAQAGWFADLATTELGEDEYMGDHDLWMLPSALRELLRSGA